jgi:hypothetical protein
VARKLRTGIMTTAPRDALSADDDPLPSLLARYRPACPSGRLWVERLACATRGERRAALVLEATRARAAREGPPSRATAAADADLLASLARHRAQIERGRRRALARLEGLGLAPAADEAEPPRPATPPRRAAGSGGGSRQRRGGRATAAALPRLPARPLRAGGRRRRRWAAPA